MLLLGVLAVAAIFILSTSGEKSKLKSEEPFIPKISVTVSECVSNLATLTAAQKKRVNDAISAGNFILLENLAVELDGIGHNKTAACIRQMNLSQLHDILK